MVLSFRHFGSSQLHKLINLNNWTEFPRPPLIPKDEGLIWLEFTRTTAPITGDPSGEPPFKGRQFWVIKEYLDKAQRQFGLFPERPKVPISSSLPIMFDGATEASKDALEASLEAKSAAQKSQEASEKSAKRAGFLTLGGGLGLFVASVTVIALMVSILSWASTTKSVLNELAPRVDKIEHDFDIHGQTIQTSAETDGEARTQLTNLIDRSAESFAKITELEALLDAQNLENKELREDQQRLQNSLNELKSEIQNPITPSQPNQ